MVFAELLNYYLQHIDIWEKQYLQHMFSDLCDVVGKNYKQLEKPDQNRFWLRIKLKLQKLGKYRILYMKWLKIFSVLILSILIGIGSFNALKRYLAISAINDHSSELSKIEGNILYINGALDSDDRQNDPGYGMLKNGRDLTPKEYACMTTQGIFNAVYENGYYYIICYSNDDELLYIGYD